MGVLILFTIIQAADLHSFRTSVSMPRVTEKNYSQFLSASLNKFNTVVFITSECLNYKCSSCKSLAQDLLRVIRKVHKTLPHLRAANYDVCDASFFKTHNISTIPALIFMKKTQKRIHTYAIKEKGMSDHAIVEWLSEILQTQIPYSNQIEFILSFLPLATTVTFSALLALFNLEQFDGFYLNKQFWTGFLLNFTGLCLSGLIFSILRGAPLIAMDPASHRIMVIHPGGNSQFSGEALVIFFIYMTLSQGLISICSFKVGASTDQLQLDMFKVYCSLAGLMIMLYMKRY